MFVVAHTWELPNEDWSESATQITWKITYVYMNYFRDIDWRQKWISSTVLQCKISLLCVCERERARERGAHIWVRAVGHMIIYSVYWLLSYQGLGSVCVFVYVSNLLEGVCGTKEAEIMDLWSSLTVTYTPVLAPWAWTISPASPCQYITSCPQWHVLRGGHNCHVPQRSTPYKLLLCVGPMAVSNLGFIWWQLRKVNLIAHKLWKKLGKCKPHNVFYRRGRRKPHEKTDGASCNSESRTHLYWLIVC